MKKIICISICWLSMHFANAQTFNPQLAAMLQDTLNNYVAMISNIKGMSASVYVPGQGVWTGTSGLSYAGHPITSDMRFGIASNSKLFAAVAMLQLDEAGIISLDDSLHKWLPSYANVNPNITIRQLLNHTSGISDPIFVAPWMDTIMAHPNRVFSDVEVVGWLAAPTFAPGQGYGYSNVNYILAGMVAKEATGSSIAQLIRQNILDPLDMDSTFYDVEESANGTIAHRWWNNVDFHDTSRVGLNSAGGAAGSIFSTSSEMVQWYNALFSGQLINQNSIEELSTFVETSNPNSDYGLGLSRITTQGRTYWGHGGTTWGYRSSMIYDTCRGVAVAGLTNSFPSGMEAVSFLLYRVVMNHVPGCAGAISGQAAVCQGEQSITYTIPPIPNATSYSWTLPSGASGVSATNTIVVNFSGAAVSGEIIVRGVNNYGPGGWASFDVVVNPIPPTPVVSIAGDVLSSSAPSGNQWYNSLGIMNGETNPDLQISVNGDYYVIVTLAGCSSAPSNSVHTSLGLNEASKIAFGLYPNPAKDELFVTPINAFEAVEVEILSASGQTLMTYSASGKLAVSISSLKPGVYFVRLSNSDGIGIKRFVKD